MSSRKYYYPELTEAQVISLRFACRNELIAQKERLKELKAELDHAEQFEDGRYSTFLKFEMQDANDLIRHLEIAKSKLYHIL